MTKLCRRPGLGRALLLGLFVSLSVASMPARAAGTPPADPQLTIETGMHTAAITRIFVSPTTGIVATASLDKTVRLWSLADGEALSTLRVPKAPGEEGTLETVTMAPKGQYLLTGGVTGASWDGSASIYIFGIPQGDIVGALHGLAGPIAQIAYRPDGGLIAAVVGGKAPMLAVWDSKAHLVIQDTNYGKAPFWVEFAADGRLATSAADGLVRVYGADLHLQRSIHGSNGGTPHHVRFSPDGRFLAVGYLDRGQVDLFDAASGRLVRSLSDRSLAASDLGAVAWSEDGSRLYAAGDAHHPDGNFVVCAWDARSGAVLAEVPVGRDTVLSLATAPGGRIAYSTGDPAWGVIGPQNTVLFAKHGLGADFRDVAKRRFAVSVDAGSVEFSTSGVGDQLLRFSLRTQRLDAVTTPDPKLQPPLLQVAGLVVDGWRNGKSPSIAGRPIRLGTNEFARSVAVAPNGTAVLLGGDFNLYLLDRYGQEIAKRPMPAPAWGVDVSGDGKRAVIALGDGTLRWVSLEPGHVLEELASFFVDTAGLRWADWTPDGHFGHGSIGGQELVGYQINEGAGGTPQWVDFRQLNRIFYAPDAPWAAVAGLPAPIRPVIQTPPSVVPPIVSRPPVTNPPNTIPVNTTVPATTVPTTTTAEGTTPPSTNVAGATPQTTTTAGATPPDTTVPTTTVAGTTPPPTVIAGTTAPITTAVAVSTTPPVVATTTATTALLQQPPPHVHLVEYCPLAHGQAEPEPGSCRPAAPVTRGFARLPSAAVLASGGVDAPAAAPSAATAATGLLGPSIEAVVLRLQIEDEGAGVGDVDIFLNGRNAGREPVTRGFSHVASTADDTQRGFSHIAATADETQRGEAKPHLVVERVIPLDSGQNVISVRAYNNAGIFAVTPEIELLRNAAQENATEQPVLYVLAAGVDHYGGEVRSLNFALADARSVSTSLSARAPSAYSRVEVNLLSDREVTREALGRAFADLSGKVQPRDSVVIYLAGHGVVLEDGVYYYVTSDVSSRAEVRGRAVDQFQLISWLSKIGARNAMLMLDTCYSGSVTPVTSGVLANETGRYVLAASSSEQEALDSFDGHNGVFAHAVLAGLNGDAAPKGKHTVDAIALGLFVRDTVYDLARDKGQLQTAEFKGEGGTYRSFPVARAD
jgi:WD40 repeat protein